jgi:hypothetical protein
LKKSSVTYSGVADISSHSTLLWNGRLVDLHYLSEQNRKRLGKSPLLLKARATARVWTRHAYAALSKTLKNNAAFDRSLIVKRRVFLRTGADFVRAVLRRRRSRLVESRPRLHIPRRPDLILGHPGPAEFHGYIPRGRPVAGHRRTSHITARWPWPPLGSGITEGRSCSWLSLGGVSCPCPRIVEIEL